MERWGQCQNGHWIFVQKRTLLAIGCGCTTSLSDLRPRICPRGVPSFEWLLDQQRTKHLLFGWHVIYDTVYCSQNCTIYYSSSRRDAFFIRKRALYNFVLISLNTEWVVWFFVHNTRSMLTEIKPKLRSTAVLYTVLWYYCMSFENTNPSIASSSSP